MRSAILVLLAAGGLAACANPVAQQAAVDTRHDAVRSDTMLALKFAAASSQLDSAQRDGLKAMVSAGRRAQRDEFVVVTDGSGGTAQLTHARRVAQNLSDAGARWVSTAIEPAMAMGPNSVVVVRSEYLIANNNCPRYVPAAMWNPNEAAMPGFGCGDAYNMGQMLARPRDAAVGRSAGPADGTVNAEAINRYREGKVRWVAGASTSGTGGGAAPPSPTN
ncbi:MAG: CpaD family pilus assembly protein [Reyranella sp.]|nr:CpaD family pilus assembly protein [Reyranella sp.]